MAIGDELASLDFANLIGGPLNAVIRAQAQAANTSVDFIKSVGFEADGTGDNAGKPTMITFKYDKAVETKATDGSVTTEVKPFSLTVPFLTMVPIPFIRIEETTVDFNAKINSVQQSTSTHSTELNASLGIKGGWGPVSAELKVSVADKRSTSASSKEERTYSMAVHVRAVQDELPAGTSRLLNILENNIKETAVA
jgi:hypothetical protein